MKSSEKPKAWITVYDEYGDENGTLAGNKEGLEILKQKIDAAIEHGDVGTEPELDADFLELRLETTKRTSEGPPETTKDQMFKSSLKTSGLDS